MKIMIDTANIQEINEFVKLGFIDGVTTNPKTMAEQNANHRDHILKICQLLNGPVGVGVIGDTYEEIVAEAQRIASINSQMVVNIPVTATGLKAINILSKYQVKTNATLVFSEAQALLAAQAGATYVSVFVGRLVDAKIDGIAVISNISKIFKKHGITSKIVATSIKTPGQAWQVALAGADYGSIKPNILAMMTNHPLTIAGVNEFKADYQAIVK